LSSSSSSSSSKPFGVGAGGQAVLLDGGAMGRIMGALMPAIDDDELAALIDKWLAMSHKELQTALKWIERASARVRAK
jgi:hypothetical protein